MQVTLFENDSTVTLDKDSLEFWAEVDGYEIAYHGSAKATNIECQLGREVYAAVYKNGFEAGFVEE